MNFTNKLAILKVLNKSCKNPEFPSFTHLVIDNENYIIKNADLLPSLSTTNDSTYVESKVVISGESGLEVGHMPNPMVKVKVINLKKCEAC